MRRITCPAIVLAMTSTATVAQADVIAQYDFEFSPEPQNRTFAAASKDTDANSVATSFAASNGIQAGGSSKLTGIYDNSTDNWGKAPTVGTYRGSALVNTASAGSTIEPAEYYEFTVTADSGYQLDLSSLTFDYNQTNSGDSYAVYVRSSLDAFVGDLHSFSRAGSTTFIGRTVDLSAVEFNGLTGITFRFYFTDTSGSTGRAHVIDNVVLDGAVIPEPASWTLACLGGAILLRRRRGR